MATVRVRGIKVRQLPSQSERLKEAVAILWVLTLQIIWLCLVIAVILIGVRGDQEGSNCAFCPIMVTWIRLWVPHHFSKNKMYYENFYRPKESFEKQLVGIVMTWFSWSNVVWRINSTIYTHYEDHKTFLCFWQLHWKIDKRNIYVGQHWPIQ